MKNIDREVATKKAREVANVLSSAVKELEEIRRDGKHMTAEGRKLLRTILQIVIDAERVITENDLGRFLSDDINPQRTTALARKVIQLYEDH